MTSFLKIEEPALPAVPRGFALWQLGFRPFYLLASSFAALSIALWALQFAGVLPAPYLPGRCGMRTRCCSASRWR